MGKKVIFLMLLPVLVIALAGVSYGWQGRMGGMGDPFGLVADESDFLIHPAKIAKGQGVRFYGDYRFTYTGVSDWDYRLDTFTPAGVFVTSNNYETSGQEFKHNVLVGAGFPLGKGRMGAFFTYDAMRGDYDGKEDIVGVNVTRYDLTKDLDNLALRILYGLPIGGGFNLGGEVQFSYRQEENKNDIPGLLNYTLGTQFPQFNLTPFQIPYDSSYWEALFKGSLDGKVGPLDLEFTLRWGFIFAGDNNFTLTQTPIIVHDGSGDVTGWRIGGDLWARYPLAADLTLPFLMRVDYQEKTWDGTGQRNDASPLIYPYKGLERNVNLTIGGGMDKKIGKGTEAAIGIYYNYLKGENDFKFIESTGIVVGQIWIHSGYPDSVENQFMLRLAGEHAFSPMVSMRMGLNFFYGWVQENFTFQYNTAFVDSISPNGSHLGIGGSLGGTIKLKPITLEPFIAGGWQRYQLDGDGDRKNTVGTITNLWEMDKSRSEWNIGGGVSVLFDL